MPDLLQDADHGDAAAIRQLGLVYSRGLTGDGPETFIASTDSATAMKNVTVANSTTTAIVALNLQPKA